MKAIPSVRRPILITILSSCVFPPGKKTTRPKNIVCYAADRAKQQNGDKDDEEGDYMGRGISDGRE